MADLKWIKIATDIFDDEKILLMEARPDADSILIIWIKLLALAGKTNNSGVFVFSNDKPYTTEMLATIFRRPVDSVASALDCFEDFGLIERINGVITIPNWEKHQSIDKLERLKEQSRESSRRYREKQKQLVKGKSGDVTVMSPSCHSDATEENRTEKNNYIVEIINHLNHVCNTSYKATTPKTKQLIIARMNEGFSVDDFKAVIDEKASEWLKDGERQKYLRPQTLFGTQFESYLQQSKMRQDAKPQRQVTTHAEIEAIKQKEGLTS